MRARRGLLAFRAVFYPGVVALAAFVLLHARASGEGTTQTLLDGRTGQGQHITLSLLDSRPSGLWTHLVNVCPTGARRGFDWSPKDGDPVPFHVDGSRLHVEETHEEAWAGGVRGHVVADLDATIARDSARGTLDSTETIEWSDGRTMTCSSGPVRFAVSRAAGGGHAQHS